MVVTLYNTSSPAKKIYKTLTNSYEISGVTFLDSEDIVNPVLILNYTISIDRSRFNYCYIPNLHRYYFISGFEVMTGQCIAIYLHCDVLMTYKPYLIDKNLNVVKKGSGGSTMIPDTGLPIYPYRDMKVAKFNKTPFTSNTFNTSTRCFILNVAGKESSS